MNILNTAANIANFAKAVVTGQDDAGDEADFDVPDEVLEWDVDETCKWLSDEGFEEVAIKMKRHRVDGSVLVQLTVDDFVDIGVTRVGVRKKCMDVIKERMSKKVRKSAVSLSVPTWPEAYFQMLSFAWAETSQGKSGSEQKDEVHTAALCISLVSALLTGMAYDWFYACASACFCIADPMSTDVYSDPDQCMCTEGHDMSGDALVFFFFCSGIAGNLLLCGTIVCIVQILASNEMSDEEELEVYFEEGKFETISGQLVAMGITFLLIATFQYILGTQKLGVFADRGSTVWARGTLIIISIIIAYSMFYATADMIRVVYMTKLEAANVELKLAEEKRSREAMDKAKNRRNSKVGLDDGL